MIYSIVLYLIFILPFSLQIYKKVGKKWMLIKILNSIITFYVFVLLTGNVRRLIVGLSDHTFLLMKNVPLGINIVVSIFYSIVSFIAIIQVIKLAFKKETAIVFFSWLIPFLWLFTGIDKYYTYVEIYNQSPSSLYVILSNAFYALIWGCFFIFYRSKKTKAFFQSN